MSKREKRTERLRMTPQEKDILLQYRAIQNEAIDMGIDPKDVHSGWLKNKNASLYFKNPGFNENGLSIDEIEKSIDSVIKKHKVVKKPKVFTKPSTPIALKATVSDSHVGMNPNPDNNALFQYEYNADIFKASMDKVYNSIMSEYATFGEFDVVFLDDLGDAVDGWSKLTTRGTHELDQNLSNQQMFETCVDAKVELISNVVQSGICDKVVVRLVANDNHAGDFALIIATTVKKVINLLYQEEVVHVDVLSRFLEHRVYGDHCYILTHGKDKKYRKNGLPLVLNADATNFVNEYIYHYGINSKYIHLEKGDLHQISYQSTKKFDYRNFMSLAPPSAWVQHNFADSYSGYSIQVIPKHSNEIKHTDYWIDYRKKV